MLDWHREILLSVLSSISSLDSANLRRILPFFLPLPQHTDAGSIASNPRRFDFGLGNVGRCRWAGALDRRTLIGAGCTFAARRAGRALPWTGLSCPFGAADGTQDVCPTITFLFLDGHLSAVAQGHRDKVIFLIGDNFAWYDPTGGKRPLIAGDEDDSVDVRRIADGASNPDVLFVGDRLIENNITALADQPFVSLSGDLALDRH